MADQEEEKPDSGSGQKKEPAPRFIPSVIAIEKQGEEWGGSITWYVGKGKDPLPNTPVHLYVGRKAQEPGVTTAEGEVIQKLSFKKDGEYEVGISLTTSPTPKFSLKLKLKRKTSKPRIIITEIGGDGRRHILEFEVIGEDGKPWIGEVIRILDSKLSSRLDLKPTDDKGSTTHEVELGPEEKERGIKALLVGTDIVKSYIIVRPNMEAINVNNTRNC